MCEEQHPGYHMLEVMMRRLRRPTLESVIGSDMYGGESIKLLHLLFKFESYFGLILGARSS